MTFNDLERLWAQTNREEADDRHIDDDDDRIQSIGQ